MAKSGRKSLLEPTVAWKVYIPISLAVKADLLNLDPVRGTVAYGKRSELVTKLLRDHLTSLGEGVYGGDSVGDINTSINLPINPQEPHHD